MLRQLCRCLRHQLLVRFQVRLGVALAATLAARERAVHLLQLLLCLRRHLALLGEQRRALRLLLRHQPLVGLQRLAQLGLALCRLRLHLNPVGLLQVLQPRHLVLQPPLLLLRRQRVLHLLLQPRLLRLKGLLGGRQLIRLLHRRKLQLPALALQISLGGGAPHLQLRHPLLHLLPLQLPLPQLAAQRVHRRHLLLALHHLLPNLGHVLGCSGRVARSLASERLASALQLLRQALRLPKVTGQQCLHRALAQVQQRQPHSVARLMQQTRHQRIVDSINLGQVAQQLCSRGEVVVAHADLHFVRQPLHDAAQGALVFRGQHRLEDVAWLGDLLQALQPLDEGIPAEPAMLWIHGSGRMSDEEAAAEGRHHLRLTRRQARCVSQQRLNVVDVD
mmetsp:Transcript_10813/g.27817  ORF Transcript_10813/g.27817 Transcript_10813/m.27817 type:complete len:391 (+) Transcript_10813:256-1428(+)